MRSLGKHTLAGTEQGDGGWHAVVGWVMPYADGEDEQDAEEGEAVDAGQRRHVVLKHHHLRRRRGEREGVGERSKRVSERDQQEHYELATQTGSVWRHDVHECM